jgi:hypothetical protein
VEHPRDPAWILSQDGSPFRWRRSRDGVVAEWEGVLTLRVEASGRVVHEPAAGADPDLVHKVTRTGAVAFLRALGRQPSLHGSAVARSGLVLVCLGEPGAGKSSVAAELCQHHGFDLLADDVVAIDSAGDRWSVLATESAHWLARDGASRKTAIPAASIAGGSVELGSLVVLRLEDRLAVPRVTRLRGTVAYSTLSASLLRFEHADALRVRELDVLSSLAARCPVYDLVRDRSCSIPETARLLLRSTGGER